MSARKNTTSPHMKSTPRKSRIATLVVAVTLVAAFGGARAVLMSSSAGSVAADPAAATQVVEAQFATAKAENVYYTAGQCCDLALKVFDEDGLAANVTVSDLIEGGGTIYYKVEFDRYRAHFCVQVDAVTGKVLGAVSTTGNEITAYDANGTYLDTAEM